MNASPLPKDTAELLALAQGIATVLSEKQQELGISPEAEALLRASIAAARFAIDTYLAVLAGAKKSPEAMKHLSAARVNCDRNIRQLRRRVTRSITRLCRLMSDGELTRTVEYVLAISS